MDNTKVIERGLEKAYQIIDARVLKSLQETAYDLVERTNVPIWTHNLWDSIGCGIYKNGSLMSYSVPPTQAEDPRSGLNEYPLEARVVENSERPIWGYGLDGLDRDAAYWGTEQLFRMIESPPMEILAHKGWALYYVSAQPYSEIIDKKYDGSVFRDELVKPLFQIYIHKI